MLKNYIKVIFRNLLRNKGYSVINILGLSLSMALGLLIIQMIVSFTGFDLFQANKERIFRVNTLRSGEDESHNFATSPFPLPPLLAGEAPGVEAATQVGGSISGNAMSGGKILPLWAQFADSEFFRVFSFKLERGDPAAALREPNSIVLASGVARSFFRDGDPVGQVIRLGKWGNYKVTGVLEDLSRVKTHMELQSLVSAATLGALQGQKLIEPWPEDWTDLTRSHGYVLLRQGASPAQVEDAANRLAASHIRDPRRRYRFWLQGLTDIVNGPDLENSSGEQIPMAVIYVLSAVALLVVLSAAFNYTNLSIARALSRAREVGIRKVVGAKRGQLFSQFIGEGIVLALLSLGAAFVLYRALFIPLFQGLHRKFVTYFQFRENGSTLAAFFAFAVFTGLIAGALPALHISRFSPVQVLRNLAGLRVVSRITTRKILIVFQFGLSVVFAISTLVAVDQVRMVQRIDLGFQPESLITVPLEGLDYGRFRQRVLQEPGIASVAGTTVLPGVSSAGDSLLTRSDRPVTKTFIVTSADAGYIPVFGLRLLAGNNFSEVGTPEGDQPLIINETAVKQLEFDSAESAVGRILVMKDGTKARVVGVVADFVHSRLTGKQGAFALSYRPESCRTAVLRLAGTDLKAVTERLQRLWTSFESAAPFRFDRMTDQIEDRMAGEKVIIKCVRFVALLAVFVTCLGLLGIADYSSRIRRRELGIRKVCGAGDWTLVRLLSQGYLFLLLAGAAAAVPVAWGLNKLILSLFDQAVGQRVELFLAGALVVGALGLGTVLSQTIRAVRVNPAEIIRNE